MKADRHGKSAPCYRTHSISDRVLQIAMVKNLCQICCGKIVIRSTASRARSCSWASVRSLSVSDDAVVLWIAWTDSFCYRTLAKRWSKGGSNNGHLHSAAQIADSSVIAVSSPRGLNFCIYRAATSCRASMLWNEKIYPLTLCKHRTSSYTGRSFPRTLLHCCTMVCEIGHIQRL